MNKSRIPDLNNHELLYERYVNQRQSASAIARDLGTTRLTVTRALERHGIPIRGRPQPKKRPPELDDRAFLEAEVVIKPLRLVAKELGCSYSAVRTAVVGFGIELPKRTSYHMTVDKSPTIKRALKSRYPKGRTGSAAANWRGGRRMQGPYWWLHRELVEQRWPNHPQLKRKNWTFRQEHILVKEAEEGRCMRKNEVVHHENLDKTDNHPDNLVIKKQGEHIADHFSEPRTLRAYITYLRHLLDHYHIEYKDPKAFRAHEEES